MFKNSSMVSDTQIEFRMFKPDFEINRPRPPGEEAVYKYPTHRVGYHLGDLA